MPNKGETIHDVRTHNAAPWQRRMHLSFTFMSVDRRYAMLRSALNSIRRLIRLACLHRCAKLLRVEERNRYRGSHLRSCRILKTTDPPVNAVALAARHRLPSHDKSARNKSVYRGDRLDDVLRLQCALFVSALNLQCCVMDREALL